MGNLHSRRLFLGLGISVAALPLLASCAYRATTKRVPRIGFLMGYGLPAMTGAFNDELGCTRLIRHGFDKAPLLEFFTSKQAGGLRPTLANCLHTPDMTTIANGGLIVQF